MRATHIAKVAVVAVITAGVQVGAHATAGAATMIETASASTVVTPQPLRATAIPPTPHCVVDLAAGGPACYPTEEEAQSRCPVLLMRVYDGTDFTRAAAWLSYCFDRPCQSGVVYQHDRIDYYWPGTNYGVNNRISSVETFNNCDVKFYDYYDTNRPDNPSSDWIGRDGNLAEWSNRASSFRLR